MLQALPYHEPTLIQLLVLASFLYLCNIARIVTDYFLYAGIVAEITLGIVYGSPLANLLPADWEHTFTALGYLGLILVVFEGTTPLARSSTGANANVQHIGGLSTNLPVLVSNLPLSTLCALVGIGLPIALSFALLNVGFGYRPLEAFAAGAALSSTSLGTTLAALNSVTKSNPVKGPSQLSNSTRESVDGSIPMSNDQQEDMNTSTPTLPSEPTLQQSRIGTVLISAAIIDDVIGLVIASLIPALATIDSETSSSGSGQGRDNLAWTIVRPLLSSCLIAAVGAIVARFILRPLFWYRRIGERWCAPARHRKPWGLRSVFREGNGWGTEAHADAVKLFLMVAVVSALAAITTCTCPDVCVSSQYTLTDFLPFRHEHQRVIRGICVRPHPDVYLETADNIPGRARSHCLRSSPVPRESRLLRGRLRARHWPTAELLPPTAILRQHRVCDREL